MMPCATCRFYRVKAELGSGRPEDEHGICDQSEVQQQVRIMWGGLPPEARECIGGIRFRGDFGCDHFEEAPWNDEHLPDLEEVRGIFTPET
jgi:hypothetical protein